MNSWLIKLKTNTKRTEINMCKYIFKVTYIKPTILIIEKKGFKKYIVLPVNCLHTLDYDDHYYQSYYHNLYVIIINVSRGKNNGSSCNND